MHRQEEQEERTDVLDQNEDSGRLSAVTQESVTELPPEPPPTHKKHETRKFSEERRE